MSSQIKDQEVAAQEEIWQFILGFTATVVVKCAIELGIPDILKNCESPMTLADLVSKLKCPESSLYRIMRFLIHFKVLGNEDSPFEATHGKDLWGFVATNPSHSKFYNDGTACDARAGVWAVIEGFPEVFKGVRKLVDVGGGDGTTLRLIVEACPWIKGINFDLPHVVSIAPACVDEDCVAILRKSREAIPQDTVKVIVVDVVVGREDDHEFKVRD
ncbi:hypothetical protein L1987_38136 [Smallanthus sonchifolius]|uniref:Uncharacterized protein n=1 Tax=Smallanthus sonchifolius TaxID=185202 RepID=A0ACB9HJK3_9ASTR|nr:hypothetical protein L1987_38136 [Smallanthus sonchifolius]